ncbi:MAG: coagulation factor 5/8 type protein [Phenylobacterium sp.]|uniref:glycosyl hydrolase family 28-related protein n=1 Tax=Phenylobacterium sp. TaxID=1871053 RepID=UPI002636A7D6|nr:glycosyl hydrolase family 28-related protein [Phenylobacterium sp.]MDB5464759.1 coagulation factor 5/8 type protein [Phenylobacterium sp.]
MPGLFKAILLGAWLAAAPCGSFAAAPPPSPTPATVAALAPQATLGRGARAPFVEYEAENGLTNGEIIGPDRTFTTLAAEASGRRAVRLEGVGGYVEFVLDRPADAVSLRYALPDSPEGRGLEGEIALYADGVRLGALALTSRYGWFYGRYPFTNQPKDGRPHHFYDEARLRLARVLPAGTRVRFVVEKADGAAWRVLDLADFELVGPPARPPANAISILSFGADPTGNQESSGPFAAAIALGRRTGRPVWIAPGAYRVDGHILVDQVTLVGAGPWHSILKGRGVGVFGHAAPHGSRRVVLRDFAIVGEVDERVDEAKLAGVGGAMSQSTISNLWIQHTKGGLWFDGPMSGIRVRGLRLLDLTADGLNFHRDVSNATVEDTFVRNAGDDGLASWSQGQGNRGITFRRNTIIAPVLANGIAIYGGRDTVVEGNLVADTLTEGGGLHLGSRFKATPFGGKILLARNTAVRAGVMDPNWRTGVGALWLYALDGPIDGARIRVEDTDLIDSSYEAIQFIGKSIRGVSFTRVRIDGAGTYAVQLQSSGGATFAQVKARGLGIGGVYDCSSRFELVRARGNEGWDTTYRPAPGGQCAERR